MIPDSNNPVFQLAADFVNQTLQHIFITGKARTGKNVWNCSIVVRNDELMMIIRHSTGNATGFHVAYRREIQHALHAKADTITSQQLNQLNLLLS